MIIAIDTETYEYDKINGCYKPVLNAQSFTLGCAKTDTGVTMFFYDRKSMWDWLINMINRNKKNGKRTFIYGHNMEYDWYAIAKDNLLNDNIKYICYNPFIAIYDGRGYFLDTMAFYRMALKNVGDILGFPKGDLPMNPRNIEEIKPYLERDVDIVLKAITNLKEKINELGFKPRKLLTAGQLAITSFLTYCRRAGIDDEFTEIVKTGISKNNKPMFRRQIVKCKNASIVREAFRGGMNQCFKLGKFKNVTLIDANGLYAYIMTIMDFPDLRTELFNKNTPVGLLEKYFDEHIGVARIQIKAPKMDLPFLPIRFTRYTVYAGNRIMRGTWTFQELKRAISYGYEIIECEWSIRWKKAKINPLKDFINHLYEMEKKYKTSDEKLPLKLIRNNLYGKFAQYKSNKDYKVVPRYQIQEFLVDGYTPTATIGDKYICVKEMDKYDPSYTNPIISTIITAGARMYLYDNLLKVPNEDRLYCDTDSIAFTGNHLSKFSIGKNLGDWKIEAQGNAKFLGEKRYYIADKPKVSGLMKREINIDIIENETDVHTQRMVGLQTGIRENSLDDVGTFRPHIQEMKPHNKLLLFIPDYIDEVRTYE